MKKVISLLLIILSFGSLWFFRGDWQLLFERLSSDHEGVSDLLSNLEQLPGLMETAVSVRMPEPLRGPEVGENSNLTVAGIISQTNLQRRLNNLPPLTASRQLSHAGTAKADDMFAHQYFAHLSPQGRGPADIVSAAGYDYIAVGENLALGNFADDKELVQAWMDSPGHRENILSSDYKEIGIGLRRGEFEGRSTWLAVQEFARPRSDCPVVDESLHSQLQTLQLTVDQQASALVEQQRSLEANQPGPFASVAETEKYNAGVERYNREVQEYNQNVQQLRQLIQLYNSEVQAFNSCLQA